MKKFKMLTPGNKVCISLKTLFETLHNGDIHKTDVGHEIRRSTEDDGSEYYDLNTCSAALRSLAYRLFLYRLSR